MEADRVYSRWIGSDSCDRVCPKSGCGTGPYSPSASGTKALGEPRSMSLVAVPSSRDPCPERPGREARRSAHAGGERLRLSGVGGADRGASSARGARDRGEGRRRGPKTGQLQRPRRTVPEPLAGRATENGGTRTGRGAGDGHRGSAGALV